MSFKIGEHLNGMYIYEFCEFEMSVYVECDGVAVCSQGTCLCPHLLGNTAAFERELETQREAAGHSFFRRNQIKHILKERCGRFGGFEMI